MRVDGQGIPESSDLNGEVMTNGIPGIDGLGKCGLCGETFVTDILILEQTKEKPMDEERCIDCDDLTGRSGQAEDSFYTPNGVGPFCQPCFDDGEAIDQRERQKEALRARIRGLTRKLNGSPPLSHPNEGMNGHD